MNTMRLLTGILVILFGTMTASVAAGYHSLAISDSEARWIAGRIFQNECAGDPRNLVVWNDQEAFLSLGIGHFIWYPEGERVTYRESFSDLLRFLRQRRVMLPSVVTAAAGHCPWPNRRAFLNDDDSGKKSALVTFLTATMDHQVRFMMLRLETALPHIALSAPPADRRRILRQVRRLARTRRGRYALIDYVNFKGDGTLASERIDGKGWGLLQVLDGMDPMRSTVDALGAFAASAEAVLRRRAALDPRPVVRQQWLPGWLRRVRSYAATGS